MGRTLTSDEGGTCEGNVSLEKKKREAIETVGGGSKIQGPVESASPGRERGPCHRNRKEMNHMIRVCSVSSGRCVAVVLRTIARLGGSSRCSEGVHRFPSEFGNLADNQMETTC